MNDTTKRILLVEDEALIALDEESVLSRHGYTVVTELTGEDAVARALGDPGIDLVLMDIDLGRGMDGTEAARLILRERDVPVVFLSSHTEPHVVERTEGITSYGYVVKHSGETVLIASIKMAFKLFDARRREKEKERDLRKMMEYNETLVEASPTFIVTISPEGKTIMMNESMLRALGYEREEVVGADYLETFVPPEDRADVAGVFRTLAGAEAPTTNENRVLSKDGGMLLVEWHGRYIHGRDGKADFFFGIGIEITGRKAIENALRQSEERYRMLAENANDVIYLMSLPEGVYEYVSPSAKRVMGYHPGFFYDNPGFIRHIIHPEWMPYLEENWNAILRGEEPHSFEYMIVDREGQTRWLSQTNSYMRAANGSIVRMQGIIRDISERKRMEQELEKSEKLFRLLAENSTDVIWIMSFEGRFLYVSPSVTALAGYTPEEVLEIPFDKYVLPEYVAPVMAEIARELSLSPENRKKSVTMELRQYGKDGRIVDIEVTTSYLYNENGEAVGIQGSTRDITARKEVERTLLERTAFLQELIDAMPHPVFYKDTEGRYLGCNKAFEEFAGRKQESIIGVTSRDIIPTDILDEHLDTDRDLLENPGVRVFETRVPYADGSIRDVLMHKGTFSGADGKIAGIIGSVLDISDRKRTEEALMSLLNETDRLKERAEKLHEEKELLLREVHHRIKNNMSTVISLLNLQMRMMKDAAAATALGEARNRIQSMMVLYDKLYRSTDYRNVSMAEYLPFMVGEMVRIFPQSRTVKVDIEVENFALGVGKLVPLGILLNELISNAMKYAFPGKKDGRILVMASLKDGMAEVIVEDNGTGIPESVNVDESSGFGLRLVALLVKQLKGEIRIERGGGTRFVLRFAV
jgi:PAS domain S-box-containing protein